ncbi:MurR/RpiR family transcriptional regulator [Spongiactinospora sp. 9N601]|uniref:MurR/RpiR family transcriptional regulator n=1 Tax=Spongiactinospora sp. 9N601 TaxID=3375149 RepID=UPI0037A7C5FF
MAIDQKPADGADPRALRSGQVYSRVKSCGNTLNSSEARVLAYVLARPDQVVDSSLAEIAAEIGTATSTVVRACQSAGFTGFQDLKLALAKDIALRDEQVVHSAGIGVETSAAQLVRRILFATAQTLRDAVETVDAPALEGAIEKTMFASRILVVGNGASASPAQDAAYRLSALGYWAIAPQGAIEQHLAATRLSSGDVALLFSHTGRTVETITTAREAARAGAALISITSFAASPLVEVSDFALVAGGPDQGLQLEALTSRSTHLAVFDALLVGVAVRRGRYSKSALDLMSRISDEHSA